jgi:ribosomal RNA-processing protein 17
LRSEIHVDKRKRRNKDLEIVFDVNSHKEYVQGFRKRKQMRRKEAVKALEKLEREQKVEERAERRQAKREQYEKFLKPEDDSEQGEEEAGGDDCGEREFDDGSKRQTVRVTAIRTEEEEEDFEEQVERKKKALAAKEEENSGGNKKKMTKKGLSVLENTRLKLMGKHRRSEGPKKKKAKDAGDTGKGGNTKRKGQRRKGR